MRAALAASCCLFVAGAAGADLSEVSVGAVVEQAEIVLGRATIRPAAGTAIRQLVAEGRQVGLLVDGAATCRYLVEDPFSVPVARRNLDRVSGSSLVDGAPPRLDLQLTGAALWLEPSAGPPVAGGEPVPAWVNEAFENGRFIGPAGTLRAAGPTRPVGWALLAEGKQRWVLDVDPTVGVESFGTLRKLGSRTTSNAFADQWLYLPLIDQPIGRQWWDDEPVVWRLERMSISITQGEKEEGVISSRLELLAVAGGHRWLGAYVQQGAVDDERFLPFEYAVEVDGRPVAASIDSYLLLVDLGREVAAGETIVLEVESRGRQLQNPNGSSYWWLDPGLWYPRVVGALELGPAELTLDVPASQVPLAIGKEISRETKDGRTRLVTKADWPARFLAATAGKFELVEQSQDGVEARLATYVFGKEREARRLLGNFIAIKPFFEAVTGEPYPFGELTIVEVDEWGLGQAPAGMIFLSHEAFGTLGDGTSRLFSQGVNERFLHEIAHMWWGNMIGGANGQENWLSESFASYFAALALKAAQPGRKGEAAFDRAVKTWKGNATQVRWGGSVYLANRLAAPESLDAFDRWALLYGKGPYVIEGLRQELHRRLGKESGEKVFYVLLKSFVKNFRFGTAATRHLVGILDQVTGQSWQPWFEKYVYGTELPPVD